MLFDPRPKERIGDMFDRRREFKAILSGMEDYPITLIIGIRRVGKSSLLKATLNEYEGIGLYLDARRLYATGSGSISSSVMVDELQRIILGNGRFGFLRGISVERISLGGIQLRPRGMTFIDVLEFLNGLGEKTGKRVVLAFDEAQYLRFYGSKGGKDLLAAIAYAYDSLPNLAFVFTGSEVGLLHDFLGITEYSSPLYGRVYEEVEVKPFSRELSEAFLRRGFEEVGLDVPGGEIRKAVDELDGIPGWLVEFGFNYWKKGNFEEALQSTIAKARAMIREELRELERRSPRYSLILRALAMGLSSWSMIRDYLEAKGGPITNARLSQLLKSLEKMGWIKKENGAYEIIDPVVERVLRE
ncbi:ATP-binding protein [Thermococcus sp. JdF3]|uniref:AAA family ATPase n=1 Tax=Thermococcus sp. JdF3 TaxID=1638258 RepID=UPI00143A1223|nr:ATP-binding protein [Thermococcus sp. JdF3]NJE01119.1 ATP-binding protein [Thermococcus sp. JdF3]